jgi:iron(III) transport system permease protein
MVLCRSGIRKLAQTPNWMVGSWDTPPEFPTSFRWLQKVAGALLVVQMIVIFCGLIFSVGSWNRFVSTVLFSVNELQYSCLIVIAVILITLPLSLIVANELMKQNARSSFWWFIILIPIAIPSPLIGIGIISFWNTPTLSFLYVTSLMPIFASISRFAPYAVIILFVQYRFIDPDLFDAIKVFSRDVIDEWFQVKIPLLAPGLFIASGVVAALALGELVATIVVVPPGHETLTIKIYNYLHYGASAEVTGLCLIMAIVTFIIGLCAVSSILWWHRKRRHDQAVQTIGDPQE